MFTLSKDKSLPMEQLAELFHSVGWEAETPPHVLTKAMLNSTHIVSAWDNDKLIGLIRSMDDFVWSANIDCLVVHRDYQNLGVGSQLLTELLQDLKDIPCISVSPNERKNADFYKKFGFTLVEDGALLQLYS